MQTDQGSNRLAVGYVRMDEPDGTQISLWCRDIGRFCELGGYRLGSVFVDRGVIDHQFARTGFTDLLAAVQLTGAGAVVVPTLDHLSPLTSVRDGLKRMVEQLGARVLVAYDETGGIRGLGADK